MVCVTSVCKYSNYYMNCHVTSYILVADVVNDIWIATSVCKEFVVKIIIFIFLARLNLEFE